MARLPLDYQERARFHLGYGSYHGIPPQDVNALEIAMNEVNSEIQVDYIIELIKTLDTIFRLRDPSNIDAVTTIELYAGDINRSKTTKNVGVSMRLWRQVYVGYTEYLAQALMVVNYQQVGEQMLRFAKGVAVYVPAVPGPQIPNVGSNLYLAGRMG